MAKIERDFNNLPTVQKDIQRMLDTTFKAKADMAEDIFFLAVACLNHANISGDLTLLSNMYNAYPQKEKAEANIFRYWVGIMSTPGQKIVDDADKGGKVPSVNVNKSMIVWNEDKKQFVKRETITVDGKKQNTPNMPHSIDAEVELAKTVHWSDLAAYNAAARAASGDFKPATDAMSVARTIASHRDKAREAGYDELADMYDRMLEVIAAKPVVKAQNGKSYVVSLKTDLPIEPQRQKGQAEVRQTH